MINIYNWSYQVDKNFVRIEFYDKIKLKLQSAIKKFNGQLMPVKTESNELIVKFKNTKVVNDFINFTLELYPNFFHLINEWDVSRNSDCVLSFTAMETGIESIKSLSNTINSFITDCNTISSLTKNELIDIQISSESTICYLTFNIKFDTDIETKQFLDDFLNLQA